MHDEKNEKCKIEIRQLSGENMGYITIGVCSCEADREADKDIAQQITEKMLNQGTPWN